MASSGGLSKLEKAALSADPSRPVFYSKKESFSIKEYYNALSHYNVVGELREAILEYKRKHPGKSPAVLRAKNFLFAPLQSATVNLVTNKLLSPFMTVNQDYADNVLKAIDLSLKGYDARIYKKTAFPQLLDKLLTLYTQNLGGSVSESVDTFFERVLNVTAKDLTADKLKQLLEIILPPAKSKEEILSPSTHMADSTWMMIKHGAGKHAFAATSPKVEEKKSEFKP